MEEVFSKLKKGRDLPCIIPTPVFSYFLAYRRRPSSLTIALYLSISIF